jgi:hypothetical protein
MATKKTKSKTKKAPKKKALKKLARKSPTLRKKAAKKPKKKAALKRAAAKTRLGSKKTTARKKARTKQAAAKGPIVDTAAFTREGLRARSGGQSGDLQGLSDHEGAASESVDELLEEGNTFEADVVKGVEDAGDEGEVHTHEVPEDDVPGEYLDKD